MSEKRVAGSCNSRRQLQRVPDQHTVDRSQPEQIGYGISGDSPGSDRSDPKVTDLASRFKPLRPDGTQMGTEGASQ